MVRVGTARLANTSCSRLSHFVQYILVNLGMSRNFGDVDLDHIVFPVHMFVDYIRVYQPKDAVNIGCDPKNYPTAKYIEK
jgi:beta-glucanase (GH16 family)